MFNTRPKVHFHTHLTNNCIIVSSFWKSRFCATCCEQLFFFIEAHASHVSTKWFESCFATEKETSNWSMRSRTTIDGYSTIPTTMHVWTFAIFFSSHHDHFCLCWRKKFQYIYTHFNVFYSNDQNISLFHRLILMVRIELKKYVFKAIEINSSIFVFLPCKAFIIIITITSCSERWIKMRIKIIIQIKMYAWI